MRLPGGQLQAALNSLASANNRGQAARLKIMERCQVVYGVEPGDIDTKNVTALIAQAAEQASVDISKTGATYCIEAWGASAEKRKCKKALPGVLNAPIIAA